MMSTATLEPTAPRGSAEDATLSANERKFWRVVDQFEKIEKRAQDLIAKCAQGKWRMTDAGWQLEAEDGTVLVAAVKKVVVYGTRD
jgi:hypothetical protein